MAEFQAKNMPRQPARGLPCNGVNTKMLPIAFFGLKSIFLWPASKNCYNHHGTLKRQPFCVDCIAGWFSGGRPSPFWAQNLIFLRFTDILYRYNPPFRCQSDPTQYDHNNCIKSYGIAWYCIIGFGARAVSRKTPIYFI